MVRRSPSSVKYEPRPVCGRPGWRRRLGAGRGTGTISQRRPRHRPGGNSMSSISLVSRRALLKACGALAGSGLGLEARAQPDPPPAGVAPYRPADDTLELLVVSDGHLVVPTRMLATNVLDGQLTAFLTGRGLGADRVHFHINVAVLRTGNEYVLIDAGAGGTWEPTAGRLADNLEAAGIALDAIGKVVITHAHPDHIWGLIDELDNSLRFPRAHYLVSAREFEFWTLGEAARLTGRGHCRRCTARIQGDRGSLKPLPTRRRNRAGADRHRYRGAHPGARFAAVDTGAAPAPSHRRCPAQQSRGDRASRLAAGGGHGCGARRAKPSAAARYGGDGSASGARLSHAVPGARAHRARRRGLHLAGRCLRRRRGQGGGDVCWDCSGCRLAVRTRLCLTGVSKAPQ